MTVFILAILAAIVAAISWSTNVAINPAAQAAIKWISTFGAAFWFLAHVFWIPFCRHREQEQEIKKLQVAKKSRLTVSWKPISPCFIQETYPLSRCRLEIHNTDLDVAARNVKVQLVSINPIPRSLQSPVFPVNLLRFDEKQDTVNPDSKAYFELFTLQGNNHVRSVLIHGENGKVQSFKPDDTVARIIRSFDTLTIRVSSMENPSSEFQFELRFPTSGSPPFTLTPVA